MTTRCLAAGALALAVLSTAPAFGQDAPRPTPYGAAAANAPAATPAAAPETPPEAPPSVEPKGLVPLDLPLFGASGAVTSGTSFNPSISVIPDLVYSRDDAGGRGLSLLESADGFHGANAEDAHGRGGPDEGFQLRETEIAFSASVDPYFDATALFAASEDGLEAEEVWIASRRLPAGFAVKAGKFLSGIGYANAHHPHQWDFVDANLAQTLLLGDHGLAEKGVQVTWLPKVPFYLKLGVELLQGENERVASYHGPDAPLPVPADEGAESRLFGRKAGPRLFTGFVKVAPDLGYGAAMQVGASWLRSTLHQELHDEDGDGLVDEALEGTVDLWGVDAVLKLDSPRPQGAGDLALSAEYLFREKRLDVVGAPGGARSRQDGLYVQAVWGVAPRWQVAARWDAAGLTNSVREGGVAESFDASRRWSGALTFSPSEFSRLRLQYSRSDVPVAGERETIGQLRLQLQVSVGAHGAHPF